jgi:carbon-monoxide dehydrogenase large subunit
MVKSIDCTQCLSIDGVINVVTAADLNWVGTIPFNWSLKETKKCSLSALAANEVHYVGEPLVAVVAKDRYVAEDALEHIYVDYDPIQPLVDPEVALTSSVKVREEWSDNVALHTSFDGGNYEAAKRDADFVLKERIRTNRQQAAPLETRAVAARYEEHEAKLTVWSSTQWPHVVRKALTSALGLSEEKVRVIAPDVGGAFGGKQDVYPEEIVLSALAILTKRPIKWTAARSEDLTSSAHSRDQIHYAEISMKHDGTILGFKDRIIADIGAVHTMSGACAYTTAQTFPGPYDIPNLSIELDCVATNKTPDGPYRGFGVPEATFVLERMIEIASKKIGIDSVAVRFKNLIQPGQFPFKTSLGAIYDAGDYPLCLRTLLEKADYEKLRERQQSLKKEGRYIGIGISFYNELTGAGPSNEMKMHGYQGGWERASVRIDRTGKVTVYTGTCPSGQGLDTTLSQICAEELEMDPRKVTVIHGDTALVQDGLGTWGSRSIALAGASIRLGIEEIREKLLKIAAPRLNESIADLECHGGSVFVAASPDKALDMKELSELAHQETDLPFGMKPGLEASVLYDPPELTCTYGADLAVVEVDPETGLTELIKFYTVHDCGKVVNPLIVEGQTIGGIVQGAGSALLEKCNYDENGQLLNPNFMGYLIPTSRDITCSFHVGNIVIPTHLNFGIKGTGEEGPIGAPAAIANAIEDAVPLTKNITEIPIGPYQLWEAMRPPTT